MERIRRVSGAMSETPGSIGEGVTKPQSGRANVLGRALGAVRFVSAMSIGAAGSLPAEGTYWSVAAVPFCAEVHRRQTKPAN